jgi:predicted metal-dependent hydrolase
LKLKVESIIGDYSLRFGFKPNRVLIWRQKTKWGSCSSKGNITLNLKLVCLPEHMVKYVVFHELTHLNFKGHNRKFWQTVGMEFPNYKELEAGTLQILVHNRNTLPKPNQKCSTILKS